MIYTDLERIFSTTDIENKYALAMIVSTRARQLSEQKGRLLDGEGSERYITYAIGEIEDGHLRISKTALDIASQPVQASNMPVETDDDAEVGQE
ncbi:MAG: DNA-directed RNA polymerase subunit omega [Synergistaceae bacterium]|jgi:DNA-directed RNA polymerase omega subunit|nr:DNA-directed RNA polymerase subunit omega [Synergistaceae bacterium]